MREKKRAKESECVNVCVCVRARDQTSVKGNCCESLPYLRTQVVRRNREYDACCTRKRGDLGSATNLVTTHVNVVVLTKPMKR